MTTNNWISVKDRLPDIGERVLICITETEFTQIETAEFIKNNLWFLSYDWNNKFISKFITHWQPLPLSPPETE